MESEIQQNGVWLELGPHPRAQKYAQTWEGVGRRLVCLHYAALDFFVLVYLAFLLPTHFFSLIRPFLHLCPSYIAVLHGFAFAPPPLFLLPPLSLSFSIPQMSLCSQSPTKRQTLMTPKSGSPAPNTLLKPTTTYPCRL